MIHVKFTCGEANHYGGANYLTSIMKGTVFSISPQQLIQNPVT
jgi:hypothetical protein